MHKHRLEKNIGKKIKQTRASKKREGDVANTIKACFHAKDIHLPLLNSIATLPCAIHHTDNGPGFGIGSGLRHAAPHLFLPWSQTKFDYLLENVETTNGCPPLPVSQLGDWLSRKPYAFCTLDWINGCRRRGKEALSLAMKPLKILQMAIMKIKRRIWLRGMCLGKKRKGNDCDKGEV